MRIGGCNGMTGESSSGLVAGNIRIVRCSQFYSEQLCNVGTNERTGEEKINGINEKKKG